MPSYDIIGSIAIVKFSRKVKKSEKIKLAREILKNQKNVKTVLEKIEKVRGRLRTIKTNYLVGMNTRETIHKENCCKFKLNVETCYFSPRLAEERKEISGKIKGKDKVLVMFSGVGPYSIIIAKKAKKVVSIELGRDCYKYQLENIKLNKLQNVEVIQGDVKKRVKGLGKFDIVIMPRPNLKESFLKEAFSVSKKETIIYYYCFGKEDKLGELVEEVYRESKKARRKIKILKIKKAGDIAPYKYRYRINIRVLN